MNIHLTISSEQLTKQDLQRLIQAIRDCEQECFPDKEISIWIEAPELSAPECEQILDSIKPPYKYRYGPFHVASSAERDEG
ncbi:hypothetical protein LCGC14_1946170 [marine sediment metagenome]|uniref:Uncharacterized protein n=1 Tax=marine sediment metagenome TaxID=412755 RepID=A0A0F9FJ64_9ZZZZ